MGIEYQLRFAAPDPDRVAALLRSLPTARELPPPYQRQVGLGAGASADEWPAATVTAEADGVYFCDHCGGRRAGRLGVVVAWLVGESARSPCRSCDTAPADYRSRPSLSCPTRRV